MADSADRCPKTPGVKPGGCPADQDGDGVPDAGDRCPRVAGVKPDGCPDRDGDGVPDASDKCPGTAGAKPLGCPDRDGDGVVDVDDRCPEVAGIKPAGCPPDKDGDGVPDASDKCVNKPETRNGYKDEDGCPDKLPRKAKRFIGRIKGIRFRLNRATIRRRSYKTLNAAGKVLNKFPSLRLKIRGHTDSRGSDSANLELSIKRADAVKAYLVKRGIASSRLVTEGVGSKEPLSQGKGRRARAKNRRIEFHVIVAGGK